MRSTTRTSSANRRRPLLRERALTAFLALAAAGVVGVAALAATASPARGQTLMTQEEALSSAFPAPATVERKTAYLTDDQLARARRAAGPDAEIDQGVLTYYVAHRGGTPVGVAYFDAHRVRTKAEVAMVVVTPDGRVARVDVLKFMEPPEYRAPEGWIDQFDGRALDDELSTKGAILNLTGATLTARSLTRAVRRVLALHGVIAPFGSAP